MIYKCSECGRLTEQKEPIPPSLVCMEDMGYERSCHGNYHPLPTLDLLTRLVEGVGAKPSQWELDRITVNHESKAFTVVMHRVYCDWKKFQHADLATALIEAEQWCERIEL